MKEEYMLLSVALWIVFGAIVGWLASIIVGTNHQQGLVLNVVVGIIGAFVGGFLFRMFGGSGVTGFNFYSAIVALIGAVILLLLVRALYHPAA